MKYLQDCKSAIKIQPLQLDDRCDEIDTLIRLQSPDHRFYNNIMMGFDKLVDLMTSWWSFAKEFKLIT